MLGQFDFLQIVSNFGVSAALLLGLCYAIYKGGQWLAVEVLKPLASRHLELMDSLEKTQIKQSDLLVEIVHSQQQADTKQLGLLSEIAHSQHQISDGQTEQSSLLQVQVGLQESTAQQIKQLVETVNKEGESLSGILRKKKDEKPPG